MSPSMSKLTTQVMEWFEQHQRPMPWREEVTPYRVWISEIMSQQTRIDAVMGYFERFIQAFPTVESLANAPLDDVLKAWQGLGYYSRARNLHAAAKVILQTYDGALPQTYAALLQLPGIGPYTAGAIASIAFQERVPCVDGNVLRVMARYLGIPESIQSTSVIKQITAEVVAALPQTRPGDMNQGLMEIGALVCIPNGAPKCDVCPLSNECVAFQEGLTDVIPPKKKKTAHRVEPRTVIVVEYQGLIGIRQREDHGLLASMYELFHVEGHWDETDIAENFDGIQTLYSLPPHTHVFSHLVWQMIGYYVVVNAPVPGLQYVGLPELQTNYAIPNAFWPFLELAPQKR
jgi:A/G-specific adenine glycosylase